MIGEIEHTKMATSKKTLGVKVNGTWYRTKNWELEGKNGETIEFTPSPYQLPDGNTIYFINEYALGGSPTPDPYTPPATPATHNAPTATTDNNTLLLEFVGNALDLTPTDITDGAADRAILWAYKAGQDILSGRIQALATVKQQATEAVAHTEDTGEDFDDDIPF